MCHLSLVWLVRSTWSLLFGLLRPTPFAQVSLLLLLGRTHAVTAMQHYFWSGRLLTRATVTSLLRDTTCHAGLPSHSLEGHSFRIGAASSAAAAALPDWLIKVVGRWSSDCYQLYIRTPTQVLLSAAPRMASSSP